MGPWGADTLVWVASPAQWAVLALVLLAVLAPGVLPRLGRVLGTLAARVTGRAARGGAGTRVEVIPPSSARPTLRARHGRPLADRSREGGPEPRMEQPARARWYVPAVVSVAIGVLLWWLLQPR